MCLKKVGKGYKEVDKTNLYLAPYYKSLGNYHMFN